MIFIAILAGVSVVVARTINANLAGKIGIFQGTIYNYVIGLAFSLLFLLVSSEGLSLSYETLTSLPWWLYTGGLVGVMVVSLSNYVTPKISAFYLTIIIFIAQLFVGILIDYFALSIISVGKIIGGLLVFSGLSYNLSLDRRSKQVKSLS